MLKQTKKNLPNITCLTRHSRIYVCLWVSQFLSYGGNKKWEEMCMFKVFPVHAAAKWCVVSARGGGKFTHK